MTYKLICLDMDGTLLNDKKELTERTKEAIKRTNEKGICIALSTGRIFTSARYYADLLGIKAPIIASNGAYIREKDNEKIIYKSTIGKENCEKLLEIMDKYNLKYYYNTFDTVISPRPFPKGYTYLEMNPDLPEDMKVKLYVTEDMKAEFIKEEIEILKFICISKDFNTLNNAKEDIIRIGNFEVASSLGDNFEVMNKGITKGSAVKALAKLYGFKKEEVMCVGDGENDLSMIEYAGLGVAMGNAPDFVKGKADYITGSNNENGVAELLEKFFL